MNKKVLSGGCEHLPRRFIELRDPFPAKNAENSSGLKRFWMCDKEFAEGGTALVKSLIELPITTYSVYF